MHELELLLDQFNKAAERFSGLTHVSVTWPEDAPSQLPEQYRQNSANLVKLWEYSIIRKKKHVVARRHWLLRPKGEKWNKDAAFRSLRKLAEEAMQALRYRENESSKQRYIDRLFGSEVFLPGEEEYNDMEPAVEWCLNLYWHVLEYPQNKLAYSTSPTKSRGSTSWIEDVFYESTKLVRTWLTEDDKQVHNTANEKTIKLSNLPDIQQNIIKALKDKILTTDEIARKSGYEVGGHLKSNLALLVKKGILKNRKPGYQLQEKYLYLSEE